ncbi:hypothetical protein ACFLT9_13680, partial [Acidobacteriota bacterium]
MRNLLKRWGGLLLLLFAACSPSHIFLTPVPKQIESIEGHAKLSLASEGGSGSSRFSFLFHMPDQGRIEVSNFLQGTLYQILIDRGEAFFILPSKRVFWQGEEEEIIDKFLGFGLKLEEMINLLSGQWTGDG